MAAISVSARERAPFFCTYPTVLRISPARMIMMAMTTINSMRVKARLTENDECRMTNDEGMTKCRMSRLREGPAWQANVEGLINAEERMRARFLSSFVIRIS